MNSNYVVTGGSFISEDELYHYGIKGMKWGVRRYQNPDGTLTPAGKKKYSKEVYKKIEYSGKHGKTWYEISDELSKDNKFKSVIEGKSDLRKAHKEFSELSDKRNEAYEKQSKSISKKRMEKMVSDEIENNRDYYQSWKPRFFDKTGAPTEELKFYVQDAIEAEHASKNQSFKELDDAYNRAWKKYDKLRRQAVDELVGRHANEYIETYSSYRGSDKTAVRQIVEQAISFADRQLQLDKINVD